MQRIGIAWQVGKRTGWGVYGYQIARYLTLSEAWRPVMLEPRHRFTGDPLETKIVEARMIEPLLKSPDAFKRFMGTGVPLPFPVLHARGDGVKPAFAPSAQWMHGTDNYALTFFENTRVTPQHGQVYNNFNATIAGSSWNGALLEAAGARNVEVCIQGIDPSRFHPAERRGLFRDRFIIFSGGKIEFRKGQDIVSKAVGIFMQRHPETMMICVWGNLWPGSAGFNHFMHSPHIGEPPGIDAEGKLDVRDWFKQFGIPESKVMAFNAYPHEFTAPLMREADVALFPNRCEGGTNLVAMECMAAGVPTILSRNTGHLDIIADGCCLPLDSQGPVNLPVDNYGTEGWGESSVEEILEKLEFVFQNRDEARRIGAAGARNMTRFTWDNQIGRLMAIVERTRRPGRG